MHVQAILQAKGIDTKDKSDDYVRQLRCGACL